MLRFGSKRKKVFKINVSHTKEIAALKGGFFMAGGGDDMAIKKNDTLSLEQQVNKFTNQSNSFVAAMETAKGALVGLGIAFSVTGNVVAGAGTTGLAYGLEKFTQNRDAKFAKRGNLFNESKRKAIEDYRGSSVAKLQTSQEALKKEAERTLLLSVTKKSTKSAMS